MNQEDLIDVLAWVGFGWAIGLILVKCTWKKD